MAIGFYGEVYFGHLDGTKEVAIKTAKTTNGPKTSEQEKKNAQQLESLRAELKIFAAINRHENVVSLLGAVTTNEMEFCIVLEFCKHKGLDIFLSKGKQKFIDEIVQQKTSEKETTYKVRCTRH